MSKAVHRYVAGSPRLHYQEWVPAPGPMGVPVLFVHGFLGHAAYWAPLAVALAAGCLRAAPRRCIALDLRGRGDSEAPAQGYTVADHADDIARVVAAARVQRCVLVAASMGVAYAAAYAAREPARVAGLALGDYPARSRSISEAMRLQYVAEPTSFPDWESARAHFRQRLSFSDESWEQAKGELLRELPGGGVARWYAPAALQGLVAETDDTDWWETLAPPGRPLLVLHGAQSRALSPESLARYAGLGARLIAMPGVGHDVFRAAPAIALRELWDLLFWVDTEAAEKR